MYEHEDKENITSTNTILEIHQLYEIPNFKQDNNGELNKLMAAEGLTCTSTEASGCTATVTAKASDVPGSTVLALTPVMLMILMSDGA